VNKDCCKYAEEHFRYCYFGYINITIVNKGKAKTNIGNEPIKTPEMMSVQSEVFI
jgi:hypothetical protein